MARRQKIGGRHASIGGDRFINASARDAVRKLGGTRIAFGRVIVKASKSHPRGSWRLQTTTRIEGGGVAVVLYGDPFVVEARVYFAANENQAAAKKAPF